MDSSSSSESIPAPEGDRLPGPGWVVVVLPVFGTLIFAVFASLLPGEPAVPGAASVGMPVRPR